MTRRTFALLVIVTGLGLVPARAAVAEIGDQAATRVYVRADYRLMRTATSRTPRIEATLRGLLAQVERECPMVVAGFARPQDAQSSELEDEVIGAMVTAVISLDRPAGRAFVSAAGRLKWSDRKLTSTVHRYVEKVRTLLALPEPNLCSDLESWAASGFTTLSAATLTFTPRFMTAWVAVGELPPGLVRYETPVERPLLARTERLEVEFGDFEAREVTTFGQITSAVGL
jgi:hypothetical protein